MMSRLWRLIQDWLAEQRLIRRHGRPAANPVRDSEAGFRLMAEHSGDVLCCLAMDGRQAYVSPASTRIMGYPPHALVGRSILDTAIPEDRAALRGALAQLLGREATKTSVCFRTRRPDGVVVWLEASLSALREAAVGAPLGIVAIIRDISERKAEQIRLSALARQDELTGLANRRALGEVLRLEWQRCAKAGRPLSVLLLDVDRFKAFNDCYGHLRGDDCLRAVAMAVVGAVRQAGNLASRYGGEEFLVVLPAVSAREAALVAERLRAAVEALAMPHGVPGAVVTASIGVATIFPISGAVMRVTELLSAADQALYAAKRGGRNRVAMAPGNPPLLPKRRRVAA